MYFAFIRSLTRETGSASRRGMADGGRSSRAGIIFLCKHVGVILRAFPQVYNEETSI